MSEERLMILTMLQEGKISSQEASMLLEALDEGEIKNKQNEKSHSIGDKITVNEERKNSDASTDWEERVSRTFSKLENKLESLGDKLGEDFGEKLGSKMERLGEDISEGASNLTEKILKLVDNFLDDKDFSSLISQNYESKTEVIEKEILNIDSPILEFQAINGKVNVEPWNKNKIEVKVNCQIKKNTTKDTNHIYKIMENDNKISFVPRYTDNIGIKLNVYIPKTHYQKINVITTNGKITIGDITCDNILCDTTNSSIGLDNITSKEIEVSTKNGKIILNGVQCDNVYLDTKNAPLDIKDCRIENITAKTTNASIKVKEIETSALKNIDLTTSNGPINLSFTDKNALFKIDAKTSMGHINIDFPLVYELNNQKQLGSKRIKGHSVSDSEREIKVNVSTSNGSIKIY